jgi:bifunctional N-acetylglucosamine-1-phosphate-uridyltransferase/glucosamine-1-phosphate-acetyltransferase GlmU-like protein
MSELRPTVMVMAAGQGTRMRSQRPKVLHEAAGRPLLEHVLRAARGIEPEVVIVVVGHGATEVRARFGAATSPSWTSRASWGRATPWPAAPPPRRAAPARSWCCRATDPC